MSDLGGMNDTEMAEFALSERPRLAAYARLQWDGVRQKYVMVAPETLVVLNDTAFAVLTLCNGIQTLSEIIQQLNMQYRADVKQDVIRLMQRMAEKRLVVLSQASDQAQAFTG